MPTSYGSIISATDHGTIWRMLLKIETTDDESDQHVATLNWDWRQLKNMYESETGRSFYDDYNFGHGRDAIQDYFKDRSVELQYEHDPQDGGVMFVGE